MNKLIAILLILICNLTAMAQDLEVRMTAPNKVTVGTPFELRVTVNQQNAQISQPQFGELRVVMRSSSTNMSIINGNMSVEKGFVFQLVASAPGTYKIPAVTAEAGGKKATSKSVTIEIIGQAQNSNQGGQANGQAQANNGNVNQPSQEDPSGLFIDLKNSKSEVYVGEQLITTATIYSRYQISEFGDFKRPKFSGFWTKDLETPSNIQFDRQRINGKEYLVANLEKKALIPQKAGNLEIEPYELEVYTGDGFFHRALAKAKSKTKTIKVLPLPTNGKPANFGGAVGSFKIDMSVDKTEVNLDEPLTIKVKISGNGNFQLFDIPKLDINSAFEQYDPKVDPNENNSKTIKTVVIARQPGDYVLNGVSFSYFDPQGKTYKTIKANDINVTVTGERSAESTAQAVHLGSDVEDLNSDIRFIKQEGIKLKNGKNQFFNSFNFWLIFILLPVIFAGVLIFRLQQIKNEANVVGMKNRKAGKTSRKRLKKAETYIADNRKNEFYVEVLNALWGYLSDKLAIPVANLNRDNVQENLDAKGIDKAVTEKYLNVLDTCEFEHYAPESLSKPLSEVYTMAAEAIEEMEMSIK